MSDWRKAIFGADHFVSWDHLSSSDFCHHIYTGYIYTHVFFFVVVVVVFILSIYSF